MNYGLVQDYSNSVLDNDGSFEIRLNKMKHMVEDIGLSPITLSEIEEDNKYQYMFDVVSNGKVRKDNEIDSDLFLKRVRVVHYAYPSFFVLIFGATRIFQRISLVVGVYVSFLVHCDLTIEIYSMLHYLQSFPWILSTLLVAICILFLPKNVRVLLSNLVLFVSVVSIFSPMLRTLTEAYSSDTVFLLSGVCATVHLYMYGYYPKLRDLDDFISSIGDISMVKSVVSLNPGFLMCLLLSSRLESSEQVASFLMSAVFLLLLYPALLAEFHGIQLVNKQVSLMVDVLTNLCFFFVLSRALKFYEQNCQIGVYVVLSVLIVIISPTVLYITYRLKYVVEGPWDT